MVLDRTLPHAARAVIAAAFAVVAVIAPASAQSKKDEGETPEQYPAGPNRDDAFYTCTACHSFKLVSAQGMSRDRWDESISWMTERHNMPKVEGKDREKILDYLTTAFPERTRGGWKNPFQPK